MKGKPADAESLRSCCGDATLPEARARLASLPTRARTDVAISDDSAGVSIECDNDVDADRARADVGCDQRRRTVMFAGMKQLWRVSRRRVERIRWRQNTPVSVWLLIGALMLVILLMFTWASTHPGG